MSPTRSPKKQRLLPLALALLGAGCGGPEQQPTDQTPYGKRAPVTLPSGYAWDPEAFFFSLQSCVTSCGDPAVTDNASYHFRRAQVSGAAVSLYNPATLASVVTSDPSGDDGFWTTAAAPSGDTVYFPSVTAVPVPSLPHRADPGYPASSTSPGDPPVPAAPYLATATLRPVALTQPSCWLPRVAVASNGGVLQAVAKFLTASGQRTAANDFVNPQAYGGVAVVWRYAPAESSTLEADMADHTTVTASAGRVLHLDWAAPGDPGLPTAITAIQSARGFYVAVSASSSPIGVSVVLLPAAASATNITFTATDPRTDAAKHRPYQFSPVTRPIRPGLVSYVELQAKLPAGVPPPPPGDEPPLPACAVAE